MVFVSLVEMFCCVVFHHIVFFFFLEIMFLNGPFSLYVFLFVSFQREIIL